MRGCEPGASERGRAGNSHEIQPETVHARLLTGWIRRSRGLSPAPRSDRPSPHTHTCVVRPGSSPRQTPADRPHLPHEQHRPLSALPTTSPALFSPCRPVCAPLSFLPRSQNVGWASQPRRPFGAPVSFLTPFTGRGLGIAAPTAFQRTSVFPPPFTRRGLGIATSTAYQRIALFPPPFTGEVPRRGGGGREARVSVFAKPGETKHAGACSRDERSTRERVRKPGETKHARACSREKRKHAPQCDSGPVIENNAQHPHESYHSRSFSTYL